MNSLFDRGKEEGHVRPELPTTWLREAYAAIVVAAIRHAAQAGLGAEETAALIVAQFLEGARATAGSS